MDWLGDAERPADIIFEGEMEMETAFVLRALMVLFGEGIGIFEGAIL